MVVEDPSIRRFVAGVLKRQGHQVVEAEMAEALRSLREHKSDVSLLVTNAPTQFLEFAATVPLLYIAAFPDPAMAARFHRCLTLTKPFRPIELAECAAELAAPEEA